MAAPLAAKAYQQEAARLDPAELHVANKTIRHEAGLTLGPLSVRLTVTDYEFAPPAPPAPTPFGDVFDTAAAATELGDALPPQAAPASVLPPALAAASYAGGGRPQLRVRPASRWRLRERRRGVLPPAAATTTAQDR